MLGPDPAPTRAETTGVSSPGQRPKANVCRCKRTWKNPPHAFKFYVTGTFFFLRSAPEKLQQALERQFDASCCAEAAFDELLQGDTEELLSPSLASATILAPGSNANTLNTQAAV